MIPLTVGEIVDCCAGVAAGGPARDLVIRSVSTDTRSLSPGSLFVALTGERFDGQAFLAQAAAAGAAAAIVRGDIPAPPLPLIQTPDPLIALGCIAGKVRQRWGGKLAAVTGSAGKTTTKEMLAQLLSASMPVLKSLANENNEVGVPQTLLRLTEQHVAAVVEFGMRGPGEIRYLAQVAQPDVAIITNIGTAHIGRLGSRRAIAAAKSEILEQLPEQGAAILNRDDEFFEFLSQKAHRVVSFGCHPESDLRVLQVEDRGLGGVRFQCAGIGQKACVRLRQGGAHIVRDALAALAAGVELGICLPSAAAALEEFSPPRGRGRSIHCGSRLIVDDAYNASPETVAAALKLVASSEGYPNRVAVLGDMLELGDFGESGHAETGMLAAAVGLHRLICVGPLSRVMAESARKGGLADVRWFADSAQAAAAAADWSSDGDLFLVKGSNGTRMSPIVGRLRELLGRDSQ